MLAFEVLNQTPKAALATNSDEVPTQEEGFSFADFLKSASGHAHLIASTNDTESLSKETKEDAKTLLLSLLKNDSDARETSKTKGLLEFLEESEDRLKQTFTLNPEITEKLSVTELKYLIHKAKEYLKTKILQVDPQLTKESLPKSLKGLLKLADKLKIEVTEISYESIDDIDTKDDKKSVLKVIDTEKTGDKKEASHHTKKIKTPTPTIDEQGESIVKETEKRRAFVSKTETLKSTPLFQSKEAAIDIRHIVTTNQFLEQKTKKDQLNKSEKTDLLQSLLTDKERNNTTSTKEIFFGKLKETVQEKRKDLQTETQKTQTESKKEQINEFEKLLRNDTQNSEQKIHLHKSANTLDVKIHEAKQMMKYLSQDIKKAIDEYKPPFSRIKVKLNPQKLGEMDLTVIQRGNNVHINLSSNNAALNILTNNLHELRTQLNQNGINNASFNFNSDAQNQQQKQKERNQKREYDYFANHEESDEQSHSLEIIVPRYI